MKEIWIGEFGWEVALLYPKICHNSSNGLVLSTFRSSFPLYKDLDVQLEDNGRTVSEASCGHNKTKMKGNTIREIRKDIQPKKLNKIAIHLRSFENRKAGRSWRPNQEFVFEMLKSTGYELVFIGLPDLSLAHGSGEDKRTVDLNKTIEEIKSSKLVFGISSGAIVLSTWCNTPVFTWGDDGRHMCGKSYKTSFWNPFNVAVYHPFKGEYEKKKIEIDKDIIDKKINDCIADLK